MSGSPKYSTVSVSAVYAQREAERRRRQAAQRRARERARAQERAELAARRAREAAARRERAKAEAARKKRELAGRRAAEQQAHASRMREEQAGADARRLDEVRDLLTRARTADAGPSTAELNVLEGELARLRDRIGRAEQVGDAIEELRGRVVLSTRTDSTPGRGTDRIAVLAGLEERLTRIGTPRADHDRTGRQRCVDLLDQLRAATGPGAETRFEALIGTVEHALTRHAMTVAQQADEERARAEKEQRLAEEDRQRAADAQRQEEERAAAEQAERERVAAVLAEATDRLGVVRQAAQDAVADASAFDEAELADHVDSALRAVTDALAAGAGERALRAVEALEELLPDTEARLDELQLAHTRRNDLALALQDAMLGAGFAFTGGEDAGERVVLRFERPSGATYETTVASDDDGTPVLVYHVDGEPDVTLHPAPEGAVCDRTEDLLERVHEAISEAEGFVPGELTWQGKPPGPRARPLPPSRQGWRWTQ